MGERWNPLLKSGRDLYPVVGEVGTPAPERNVIRAKLNIAGVARSPAFPAKCRSCMKKLSEADSCLVMDHRAGIS